MGVFFAFVFILLAFVLWAAWGLAKEWPVAVERNTAPEPKVCPACHHKVKPEFESALVPGWHEWCDNIV